MQPPTREVFGNICGWMQAVFYGVMLASFVVLAWQLTKRARLWRMGQPGGFDRDYWASACRIARYALGQQRVHRKSLGGVAHLLLFSGFVVLTIGTTLLFISHAGPIDFHHGWYYLCYELTMDVFGVALCVGCVLALYRRALRRPPSLGHNAGDWALLGLLLSIGLTGFVLEALRMRYTQVSPDQASWSIVGRGIGVAMLSGVDVGTARSFHLGVWWLHAVLVAVLLATMPFTRMRHVIVGPVNIALRPSRPMGALAPVPTEEVERTGRIGVGAIEHFNRQQLLSLDACMACGRCEQVCPAWATGKPLSPKAVVLDLADLMSRSVGAKTADGAAVDRVSALHGGTIQPETLWSCTMCQACVRECPVLIGHVDLIADMRRHLVGEGKIFGPAATALRQIGSHGNPHGGHAADRMAWAKSLDVPTVESNPNFDYLLWVGCAATFDPRAQSVARSTAQLLAEAGVNFAVLGRLERCTGDPARRLGDEFLFQELAQSNIQTLDKHRVKKIVTPCPHCLNTIRNEYTQFGGRYHVQHHTQLLAELVEAGRLNPAGGLDEPVTLHDPCYLARVNGEVDAQRALIRAASGGGCGGRSLLREMPRRGEKTFCCGAGGGRMWCEEAPGQRVSEARAREGVGTGAKILATACPFCLNMLGDAVAGVEGGADMKIMDVSELLLHGQPLRRGEVVG